MSFLDYVLSSFGVHPKKEDTKATNFNLRKNNQKDCYKQKLAVFYPKNLKEMTDIAEFLSEHQHMIISLNNLKDFERQRGIDFIFGASIGSKSHFSKLDDGVFVFAPNGTQIINKEKNYER